MSRSKLPRDWYAKYATLKPIPSPAPPLEPQPEVGKGAGAGPAGKCTCGADRTGPSAEAHDADCPARADPLEGEAPPMLRITIRFEPGGEKWQKRLRWLLKHAKRALGIDFVEIAPFPTHPLPRSDHGNQKP